MRPRLFASALGRRERRIYRAVLTFFVVVLLAMVWPVVTLFSRVEPMILGLPFFLFYLTVLLFASFLVLLALYAWEGRTRGSSDREAPGPGESPS